MDRKFCDVCHREGKKRNISGEFYVKLTIDNHDPKDRCLDGVTFDLCKEHGDEVKKRYNIPT